jgi:hypothetical protein
MNKKCKVALWQGFPHSPRSFRRTINRILTSDCGLPEPMVMLRFWDLGQLVLKIRNHWVTYLASLHAVRSRLFPFLPQAQRKTLD